MKQLAQSIKKAAQARGIRTAAAIQPKAAKAIASTALMAVAGLTQAEVNFLLSATYNGPVDPLVTSVTRKLSSAGVRNRDLVITHPEDLGITAEVLDKAIDD